MAANSVVGGDVKAALGFAFLLICVGSLIGDSTVGLLIGIICFFIAIYAMCRVPIRHSMMALMFGALALPNPAEGQPTDWPPPFTPVGAALLNHLNSVDRSIGLLSAFPFALMELFFVILFMIRLYRKSSGSRLDRDALPTPKPLIQLAQLSLATTAFTWLSGLVRGGDFGMSLWQVAAVIYLPIVFLLFQTSFRGPKDHWNLARVVLAAATYRACLAVYVMQTTVLPYNPETGSTKPPYATAHADSVLFASAFVLLVGMVFEKTHRKIKWLAIGLLPIIMAGTQANNRRLAWVQIGIALFVVYLVGRETKLKRTIRRAVFGLIPVAGLYVAAGWSSEFGAFFKPVRLIRSVVDAKTDGSSMWREYENVNIIATFRDHALIGSGYGHPYREVVILPEVNYSLERYIPHNSLLGLWAYGGLVGFLGLTLLWTSGVYFAMRAYQHATEPGHRAAALVSFAVVPVYLMQAWGDLGLGTWTGVFIMGAAITVAAKVAVASGQWNPIAPKKVAGEAPAAPGNQAPI